MYLSNGRTIHAYDHTFYLDTPMRNGLDMSGRLLHLERAVVKADISGPEVSGSAEGFVLMGFYAENESYFDEPAQRSPSAGRFT